MIVNPGPRSIPAVLILMALLIGAVLLNTEAKSGPMCAVHTIRADDTALSLIRETGCWWVVQLFDWSQIEPLPGEYFWEYPDAVVRACQYYKLNLAVRLDHAPNWALSPSQEALPIDGDAYSGFVERVAQRYRGEVQAYIVWNEPNLAQEWGGQPPNPTAYVELLREAYEAVRQADPHALVVSAGLAPTNRNDEAAMDDRTYLESMYQVGAAELFDVLGAHPCGFAYPPEDPHDSHQGLNFARLLDVREIMVRNGDSEKAVWATEMGWTTAPVDQEHAWLAVTEEQQAAYLTGAFEKAAEEWPWLEMIAVWNLSAGLEHADEKRGYSIVDDAYTPRPAYLALAAMPKTGPPGHITLGSLDDSSVEILAPDVTVRLGDVDTPHPHWVRIYGGEAPCRRWVGEFYLDGPGKVPWQLTMEIMQVEEQGNLVTINGQPLAPIAIPLRGKLDFASSWTTAFLRVPPEVLRPGRNVIEIAASPRLPVYQDGHAQFESLQFRNLRLVRTTAPHGPG